MMGRGALGLTWGREEAIGILGATLVRFLCPSGIRAEGTKPGHMSQPCHSLRANCWRQRIGVNVCVTVVS